MHWKLAMHVSHQTRMVSIKVKRGRGRPPKNKNKLQNIAIDKNPSRFFKIILPLILEENRLRIPDIIATRLSKFQFPTVATLGTPIGGCWKVEISKCANNKLYFTKGWEEFMKHNFVSVGFFLVFEYRANLCFNVHIFHPSCCEIDYPPKAEEEVFETNFETTSFDVVLSKSNLFWNYLYVPTSFSRMYLKGKNKVKVEAEDGRTWELSTSRDRSIVRLTGHGVKSLRNDNNLEVGDELTFLFAGQNDDHVKLKFLKK